MAQCNAALEPTDAEILEWTSNENMRHMHQGEELRRLVERLPNELLSTAGLHRQMVRWMTQYQQVCLLDHAWRSDDLIVLLGYPLSADLHAFLLEAGDRTDYWYGFRVARDFSWDRNFNRPRDSWVFAPQVKKTGKSEHLRTIVSRRGVVVTLQDYSNNGQGSGPYLRLKYQGRGCGEPDGWAVEEKAVECITPLEDFCCPPDATMEVGFRDDGRVNIKVWAKEMSGSPVLHWIFPDPKQDGLDPAYRDFLWWL